MTEERKEALLRKYQELQKIINNARGDLNEVCKTYMAEKYAPYADGKECYFPVKIGRGCKVRKGVLHFRTSWNIEGDLYFQPYKDDGELMNKEFWVSNISELRETE